MEQLRDFLAVVGACSLWVAGVVVVCVVATIVEGSGPPRPRPCPHGFEDWADCPDCCH